jgi:hypothetical protein
VRFLIDPNDGRRGREAAPLSASTNIDACDIRLRPLANDGRGKHASMHLGHGHTLAIPAGLGDSIAHLFVPRFRRASISSPIDADPSALESEFGGHDLHLEVEVLGVPVDDVVQVAEQFKADAADELHPAHRGPSQG